MGVERRWNPPPAAAPSSSVGMKQARTPASGAGRRPGADAGARREEEAVAAAGPPACGRRGTADELLLLQVCKSPSTLPHT
jgi:hypothetical protein